MHSGTAGDAPRPGVKLEALPRELLCRLCGDFLTEFEARSLLIACKQTYRAVAHDATLWRRLLRRFQDAHEGAPPWVRNGGILEPVPPSIVTRFGKARVDFWLRQYWLSTKAECTMPSGLSDDEFAECMLSLYNNPRLRVLVFSYMLNSDDFSATRWSIVALLVERKQVMKLVVKTARTFVPKDFSVVLQQAQLRHLCLNQCYLGLKADQIPLLRLPAQTRLLRIELMHNFLDDDAVARYLIPIFSQCPSLLVINLEHNSIASQGIAALVAMFEAALKLHVLFLTDNPGAVTIRWLRRGPDGLVKRG